MNAEIMSIGTELLLGQIVDTNATHIAGELAGLGVSVYYKTVVGDNPQRMASAMRIALERSDVLITTGGLGPTMDDPTMQCVAQVMGLELWKDTDVEGDIRAFFGRIGRPMADNNLKQALVPQGSRVIRNEVGTAPGIIIEKGGKTVICMPGVPSEMRWMMDNAVIPYLGSRVVGEGGAVLVSRILMVFGIGESKVEEMVKDILDGQTNPTIAPLASALEVKLRVTARATTVEEARGLISPVEARLRERLGHSVFGFDTDSMESVVGGLLLQRGWRIATAESCTGGLIAKRLTDVPGSSSYVDRAFVTYSNKSKTEMLGVPHGLIESCGAVSSEVAIAMAAGAREAAGVELAVAVTGIAGPDGGSPEKPVGLVFIALAGPDGVRCRQHRFIGGREPVRLRTSQAALDMVRRYLQGVLED